MVTDGDHTYHGKHWIICKIVESICRTLESNTVYADYTSIKIILKWINK